MLRYFLLLTFMFLASFGVQAEWKKVDKLKLGNPTTSSAITIESKDGGYIKKENDGDWSFSKDGINEKKFGSGSGSGGGENYNNAFSDSDNANAEEGTTGWTVSGGDFFVTTDASAWATATSYSIGDKITNDGVIYEANTAHTSTDFATDSANWDEVVNADALEGDRSFVWIPSAQNDYIESSLLDVAKDIFKGQSCQSLLTYIGGDDNLTLKVIDGNGDELSFESLKAHGIAGNESGWLLCPSSDAISSDSNKGNLKLRIENTGTSASPAIKFDKTYIGTLIGLSETVLPDTFGGYYSAGTGELERSWGNILTGCAQDSTGIVTCSYNTTFSDAPSCEVSVVTGGTTAKSTSVSLGTSSVTIRTFEVSTLADYGFTLTCNKVEEEAKQQVQVLRSIPTTAQTLNEFKGSLNGSSVTYNDVSVISSCSCSTGVYTCTYSETFSEVPNVDLTTFRADSDTVNISARVESQSTTGFTALTGFTASSTSGDLSPFCYPVNYTISKKGADRHQPIVQPIVIPNAVFYGPYDLTTTGTNWTANKATGIFYTVNGKWRMKFNIMGGFSAVTTTPDVAISGVAATTVWQTFSAQLWTSSTDYSTQLARFNVGSGQMTLRAAGSTAVDGVQASGDIELAEKPTMYVPQ